ncbi:MAG: CoA-binding protein [Magnetococcus sp. WYHC-3]
MSLDPRMLVPLLRSARTIAVVGLSPKEDRPSFRVAAYLQQVGYRIVPVRPGSSQILGETCYPSLRDLPADLKVDIVDVFRKAEETPPVARDAVAIGARVLWLQSGIVSDEAMAIATAAGLTGIQDHCLMVEHRMLAAQLR